ncbi:inositol polyphosphate kinase kcs1, partial [Tieghemiomyces parasiticus]
MITPVTSSGSRSGLATGTSLHTRHLATARSTDGAPPSPLSGHLLRSASPDSELSDPETLSDGSDVDGGWSDVSATTDPTLMESLRQSLPTVPLLPYRNQVGGHSPILRFSDKAICKPLVEKERRFYESVDAIQPSLSHFLPSYLGIVNVTFGANRPRSPCDRFRLRTGDSAETDPKPVIVFEQNIHLLPSWLAEHVPRHSPNHLPFPETKLNKAWRAQQEQVLQEAFSPQALSTLCRRQRRARATPHHRRRHSLTDMSGGHMSKRVLPQHVTDSHPYSGSHPLSSSAVSANELTSPHGSDESLPGSPTRGHTLPDDLAATVGPSLAPAPATSVGIDLSHRFRQLTTDNVPAAQPLPIRSASARHRPTTSPQLIHHENRRLFVAPGFDRKALALPFQQSPAERTSPLTASPPPLPGTTGLSPALRFHRQPLTAIAELPSPHHPHGDQEDPFVMEDAPTLTPGLSPPGTPPKCRPLHHLALPDSLATPGPPTVQQDWAAGLTRRFMASKADSSGVTPDVHQFILLEDLTNGLRRPCILDLKMGTRQHGVDAPERKRVNKTKKCARTTSKSLGVRMCGMQVYKASKSRYLFQDKYYGRSLSDKTFARSLLEFLDNGETIAVHHIPRLLRRLYELYRLVITIHGFRFYASSLLIVYDGI